MGLKSLSSGCEWRPHTLLPTGDTAPVITCKPSGHPAQDPSWLPSHPQVCGSPGTGRPPRFPALSPHPSPAAARATTILTIIKSLRQLCSRHRSLHCSSPLGPVPHPGVLQEPGELPPAPLPLPPPCPRPAVPARRPALPPPAPPTAVSARGPRFLCTELPGLCSTSLLQAWSPCGWKPRLSQILVFQHLTWHPTDSSERTE